MTPDELRARVEEIREDVKHGYALPAELSTTGLTWAEGLRIALDRQSTLLDLIDHQAAEIARLEGEVHRFHEESCWSNLGDMIETGRDDDPYIPVRVEPFLLPDACPVCRKLIGGGA